MVEAESSGGTIGGGGSSTTPRLGSYRLLEPLGTGGMSSVFRAEHIETGHEVAVKVLPRTLAKNSTMLQRFLREAKNVEALDHPNIVAIYDRGVEQGRHYLVLEYLLGGDLHERVRKGVFSVNDVVEIAVAVSHALHYAFGRNVIHRDIKPANLLMTAEGHVKVTDFGLALQVEDDDERVTRDGTTVGTVDYMAPEQARDSRAASIRSDMYSLGCTLYYLLIGHAPFFGGDVADKLARHCNEPAPDPRKERPEIPEELANVILKLLAKRPERRYPDYAALLLALQPLRSPDSAEKLADVLVDDSPLGIADAGWLASDSKPGDPNASTIAKDHRDLSLVDLVALHADESPTPSPLRTPAQLKPRPSVTAPTPLDLAEIDEDEDDESDEGEDEPGNSYTAANRSKSGTGGPEISLSAMIGIGLAVGLFIGLLAIGLRQMSSETAVAESSESNEVESTDVVPQQPPPVVLVAPKPVVVTQPAPKAIPTKPVAYVEPVDSQTTVVPEIVIASEVESRHVPDWVTKLIDMSRMEGSVVTVNRLDRPGEKARFTNLKSGLEANSATIEISDNGPYYMNDLMFTGPARHLRATGGHRAVVKIEPRTDENSTAVIPLANKRLILERLDILVDTRELPEKHSALFDLKGSELVLRDCTITVLNSSSRNFSIVRIGDDSGLASTGRSRLLFDRTLIRGPALMTLAWNVEAADVVIARSVVLGGSAPLMRVTGKGTGLSRRLAVTRSLLAGQGPLLDLGGPLLLRSLCSTYARIEPRNAAQSVLHSGRSSVVGVDAGSDAVTSLDWAGESNTFRGWPSLVSEREGVPRAADLGALKIAWPGGDVMSVEKVDAWPAGIEELFPLDLVKLAEEQAPTLSRVATPTAWIREKSQTNFTPLYVPRVALTPINVVTPGGSGMAAPEIGIASTKRSPPGGAPPGKAAPIAVDPAQLELGFDTQVSPWFGDLGAFIKQNIAGRPGLKRIKVRVQGFGPRTWTPIKLPQGVSLEIAVDGPQKPGDQTITWTTTPRASANALIEVTGADLTLVGVRFIRDETSQPLSLLRVNHGHLVMIRCKLTAPGKVRPGGGGLVEFQATGSEPLPPFISPFESPNDRPTCLAIDSVFITGGIAFKTFMARGIVRLENCLLAVGAGCFSLIPENVRADRFEVDLQLDRCTLASEDSFVRVGLWPGAATGPNRPWLISTRGCLFLDAYNRTKRSSVLLKSEADTLSSNVITWQAEGDVYELTRFVTTEGAKLVENAPIDFRRHWLDFWGERKIKNSTGPAQNRANLTVRPIIGKLIPGEVQPGDLALALDTDRKFKGVGADWTRLDVTPSSLQSRTMRKR